MKNTQTPKDEVAPEKGRKCICILYYRLYMCIYHVYTICLYITFNIFLQKVMWIFVSCKHPFSSLPGSCTRGGNWNVWIFGWVNLEWNFQLAWTNEEQVTWNIKRCRFFTSILVNLQHRLPHAWCWFLFPDLFLVSVKFMSFGSWRISWGLVARQNQSAARPVQWAPYDNWRSGDEKRWELLANPWDWFVWINFFGNELWSLNIFNFCQELKWFTAYWMS